MTKASRPLHVTSTPTSLDVQWDFGCSGAGEVAQISVQLLCRDSRRGAPLALTAQEPRGAFHFLEPGTYTLMATGGGLAEVAATAKLPPLPYFLPQSVRRHMVFAGQRLGVWMLGCTDNYMFACRGELEDIDFVERLFVHGLFVLPSSDSDIVPCPWPQRPYVLCLEALPLQRWSQSKKVRRHKSSFWLTVNRDFKAHFRACARYHEERGGTWITPSLVDQLWAMHERPGTKVRVWCFELWDRATGALAAASFGLSIGAFFHDFSMCTLIKDHRSCGAVISKCVGELLARCGMRLWYWGIKCPYMAEYDAFGGREIGRGEYYAALRAAEDVRPAFEPGDPEALRDALVEARPLESAPRTRSRLATALASVTDSSARERQAVGGAAAAEKKTSWS